MLLTSHHHVELSEPEYEAPDSQPPSRLRFTRARALRRNARNGGPEERPADRAAPSAKKMAGPGRISNRSLLHACGKIPLLCLSDEMAEKEKMSEKEKNSSKSIGAIAAAVEKIAGTNDGRQRNAKISAKNSAAQKLTDTRFLRFRVLLSDKALIAAITPANKSTYQATAGKAAEVGREVGVREQSEASDKEILLLIISMRSRDTPEARELRLRSRYACRFCAGDRKLPTSNNVVSILSRKLPKRPAIIRKTQQSNRSRSLTFTAMSFWSALIMIGRAPTHLYVTNLIPS